VVNKKSKNLGAPGGDWAELKSELVWVYLVRWPGARLANWPGWRLPRCLMHPGSSCVTLSATSESSVMIISR